MVISVFDLFSIGIGPSSSHTVGPMKAAKAFAVALYNEKKLKCTNKITIELFGSLAFTGRGHGTDSAIMMGLQGHEPSTIKPDLVKSQVQEVLNQKKIKLVNQHEISFNYNTNFIFNLKDLLPLHTNGMRFIAYDAQQNILLSKSYYSIGGGFIIDDQDQTITPKNTPEVPYPFNSAKTLLELCETNQFTIKDLMLLNEGALQPLHTVKNQLLHITQIMRDCIDKGCQNDGELPGGLHIKRRAPILYRKLQQKGKPESHKQIDSMAWLNLFAIAVNEENAAGGRVVTAPTNGAAGIIPAVLHYYLTFYPQTNEDDAIDFLLTAGAIGILYKKGASISGAEVGCQGEVGVACSMAAGALTAVLGGSLYQIENAAEIAMEHHLGMTCDPIQGLVQIPCIERNAMGAVKAVNAAQLALLGDGHHFVSLDKVIATMKQTGKDMMSIYKETSLGGLAANLPEC